MRKALTYSGFAIAGLVVVAVFVTARTYTQLGGAILIYPLLAYLAFELFIRNPSQKPTVSVQSPPIKKAKIETETTNTEKEGVSVVDIDKRAFLKLIGVAGLSFFLFSIISRKSESLFFGKALDSGTTTLKDSSGKLINPSERQPTDGYRVSEIDEDFLEIIEKRKKESPATPISFRNARLSMSTTLTPSFSVLVVSVSIFAFFIGGD